MVPHRLQLCVHQTSPLKLNVRLMHHIIFLSGVGADIVYGDEELQIHILDPRRRNNTQYLMSALTIVSWVLTTRKLCLF